MIKKLVSTFSIAFALAGLGCDQPIDGTAGGRPALSAEDQAVVDNMARNTLAEIDLPEGKMVFIEVAPGDIAVMRQSRIGADMTRVEGADDMDLVQLFQAYAPGRETPPALVAAMERAHAAQAAAANDTALAPTAATTFAGDKPLNDSTLRADGTEHVSSALASSVDQAWFTSALCGFSGTNYSWCYTTAYQNAWAKSTAHKSNAAVCGDTGAAQMKEYVSGSLRVVQDVPYGQCWTVGYYHGPHDFFGSALKRTVEVRVTYAESTVRFSGWFADGDQFMHTPY
jgi:hypothetical protein